MKLTDAQKFELYRTALEGMIARAPLIQGDMPAPPNREGRSKQVPATFAIAAWANKIADAAVYVLEAEKKSADAAAPTTDSGAPAEATPF